MSEVREIQIKCLNASCGAWFPSPIFIDDIESFNAALMGGNAVDCPHCGSMTPCNKENMRVRAKNSGFVGKDT